MTGLITLRPRRGIPFLSSLFLIIYCHLLFLFNRGVRLLTTGKDMEISPFEATRCLLTGTNITDLSSRIDMYFVDYGLMSLFVQVLFLFSNKIIIAHVIHCLFRKIISTTHPSLMEISRMLMHLKTYARLPISFPMAI